MGQNPYRTLGKNISYLKAFRKDFCRVTPQKVPEVGFDSQPYDTANPSVPSALKDNRRQQPHQKPPFFILFPFWGSSRAPAPNMESAILLPFQTSKRWRYFSQSLKRAVKTI